ncbi:MAG TPA: ATP-grasp domain-containing protein [Ktedonosporobacter sp.]|nr:ATP-grasp domain-containing protein [Ktedonosporobacter sp.]
MSNRMILLGGSHALYRRARRCGFTTTVIQEKAKIQGDDLPLIDNLITLPPEHPDVVEIMSTLHQREPFDCVVSMNEVGLMPAALLQDQLHLRGNPLRPVLLTRDKYRMREHLRRCGLRSIPYATVSGVDEVIAFAQTCGWPIILKPAMGSGSEHIYKIDTPDTIEQALQKIEQAFPGMPTLAEKYLIGKEVSVEAFSWEGKHQVIAVTDKFTTGAPYFVEIGHTMPSSLPAHTWQHIAAYTTDFLTSIGHQLGPSHTEMMVTADGPYIIESHTRAGGDFIYELLEYVYGVDVYELTFQGLAGLQPHVEISSPKAAMIRYLNLPIGEVKRIAGVEEASSIEGITRCQIEVQPGQQIAPFKNSVERYGWILARGETPEEASIRISHAFHKIKIEVA